MHPDLLKFPSKQFYNDELTAATGCLRPLDPNLKIVLQSILTTSSLELSRDEGVTDSQLCLCFIEPGWFGSSVQTDDRKSVVVPDFVDVFFGQILPGLQTHFKDRTADEVIVVVACSLARTTYLECMHSLQEEQGYEESWYPKVFSVDGSRGHLATMAFFDGSMQHRDRLGFLNVPSRANVAMTRATEVYWVIGSSLESHKGKDDDLSIFAKLKQHIDTHGRVWRFPASNRATFIRLAAHNRTQRQRSTNDGHFASGISRLRKGDGRGPRRRGHEASRFRTHDSPPPRQLLDSTSSGQAPQISDEARFAAAVNRFRRAPDEISQSEPSESSHATETSQRTEPTREVTVQDNQSQSTSRDAEPSPDTEKMHSTEDMREDYLNRGSDEQRFLWTASRVRGGGGGGGGGDRGDIMGTVPRTIKDFAIVEETRVPDDAEEAMFLALARRLRGGKV